VAAVTTISTKPTAKEITHKIDEAGTHFDGFIYEGANLQEKNSLGSLYVIGQVKYGDEDLAYLVNLISSLAKREYYTDGMAQSVNAKSSFENTLKKLNEVLEDFFKNKQFKLTIGLAAIAGENIYISRLGNVKFSLARDNNYIDVINNIGLFNRDHIEEKEFSNVISGKLQPQDKLFMYLPLRPMVSREKSLRELFKKEDQATFAGKIDALSKTTANFACCGIHIEMNHVKEIPVAARPSYYTTMAVNLEESEKPAPKSHAKSSRAGESSKAKHSSATIAPATLASVDGVEQSTPITASLDEELPQPRIISADMSLARRKNFVSKLTGSFWGSSRRSSRLVAKHAKNIKLWTGLAIGVAVLVAGYFIFFGTPSPDKALIKQAKADMKIVQDDIAKGDYRGARTLGYSSLAGLTTGTSQQAQAIRDELASALSAIDKTSDKKPALLAEDASVTNLLKILPADGIIYATNTDGGVFAIADGVFKKMGDVATKNSQYLFDGVKLAVVADNALAIFNKLNAKTDSYTLDGFEGTKDATLYEGNMYVLGAGAITKYADIITSEAKPVNWTKDVPATAQSITVDGNLYLLTSDGKVETYFKGAKQSEYDLALTPSSDARIFTAKDLPFLYYTDRTARKVMVFDKASGALMTSYSLDNVGTVSDITIAKDQSIYILSSDSKVWVIR